MRTQPPMLALAALLAASTLLAAGDDDAPPQGTPECKGACLVCPVRHFALELRDLGVAGEPFRGAVLRFRAFHHLEEAIEEELQAATVDLHRAALLAEPGFRRGGLEARVRHLRESLAREQLRYYADLAELLPTAVRHELALRLDGHEEVHPATRRPHGAALRSFPSPCASPAGLASDGTSLLLLDLQSRTVFRLSPFSGRIVEAMALTGDVERPLGLAWDGHSFWTTDNGQEKAVVRLTSDFVVTQRIPVELGQPIDAGFDGQHLWIADSAGPETIALVDRREGRVVRRVPAPGRSPFGLCFADGAIWVCNSVMREIVEAYNVLARAYHDFHDAFVE